MVYWMVYRSNCSQRIFSWDNIYNYKRSKARCTEKNKMSNCIQCVPRIHWRSEQYILYIGGWIFLVALSKHSKVMVIGCVINQLTILGIFSSLTNIFYTVQQKTVLLFFCYSKLYFSLIQLSLSVLIKENCRELQYSTVYGW